MKRKLKSKKSKRSEKLSASLILTLPIYVLSKEYGWGAKTRLPGFAEKMIEAIGQIESGKLKAEEVMEIFKEMTGMEIEV